MAYNPAFNEIRPYRDEEVAKVVKRLIDEPSFYNVMAYVHPDWTEQMVRETMASVDTIHDFQSKIAHPAMRVLINGTTDNLTISGLENIRKGESYLFISNHRDIILDSAILNIQLFEAGFGTIQTAIGNNLLSSELITDLMKLNKNFVVKRNTGSRAFYENTVLLSAYIRHTIVLERQSIWIAQREGRTKDGLDKTQPGLLKMLSINCDDPLRNCFRDLRITPVAISYEYDPCDVLKVPELKAMAKEEKYEKADEEDLNSILTGLTGQKGRVHISIGKTLGDELESLAEHPSLNDKLRILGELIDQQIYQNYKLWPTNYAALNILEGSESPYSDARFDVEAFKTGIGKRLKSAGLNSDEDYQYLLSMYANPVRNRIGVKEV